MYYATITIFDVKERNFNFVYFSSNFNAVFWPKYHLKKKGVLKGTQISKLHIFGNLWMTKTDEK